jgi:dihydroneopterin aldolase
MDKLFLSGCEFSARHGCLPDEREREQRFRVSVELSLDLREAAQTDDLTTTVDWGPLYSEIKAVVQGPPCNLLETVAERVAQKLLIYERVREVKVRVDKLAAPFPGPVQAAGVEVVRKRET